MGVLSPALRNWVLSGGLSFIGASGSGGGSGGGVTSAAYDPPVSSAMTSISQLVFSLNKFMETTSVTNTVRVIRVSDSAESDFGYDANGIFDIAPVMTWAGGSDVKIKHLYDQKGTGKTLPAVNNLYLIKDDLDVRAGVDWSTADATLSLNSSGSTGIPIANNGYFQLTSSGLSTTSGLEIHYCFVPFSRKKANNSTEPAGLNGNFINEAVWSYYNPNVTNAWHFELGNGATPHYCRRITGATSQLLTSGHPVKANRTYVSTHTLTDSAITYWRDSQTMASASTASGNVTGNASIGNGTLRIGLGQPSSSNVNPTNYGNHLFVGIVITQTTTQKQKFELHSKLEAAAQCHYVISPSDIQAIIGASGEIIDWRDADSVTGAVVGRNGHLTLNWNTATVGGNAPNLDFSYTTPTYGLPGVRSIGTDNLANAFMATTNWWAGVMTGTVITIGFRDVGGLLATWWADGNVAGYPKATAGAPNTNFSMGPGFHHSQPGLYHCIASSIDVARVTANSAWADDGPGKLSQSHGKYHLITANGAIDNQESNNYVTDADHTVEGVFYPAGTPISWDLNISSQNKPPPTPENNLYRSWTAKYPYDDGYLEIQIGTFEPGTQYNPASPDSTKMRTGTVWNYAAPLCGAPLGHLDQSIARDIGCASIRQADPANRIQTSPYLSMIDGTRLIFIFIPRVLTWLEKNQIKTSIYKVLLNGWGGSGAVAPVNTVAPAITGTQEVDQTLTSSSGTWTGTPTPTYTYQWQRDTAGNGTFVNISGATTSTHLCVSADQGNKLRCVVTATNTAGIISANSNQTGLIAASTASPVNTVAPVASGTAAQGQVVSTTTGTWTGATTITYTYQWKRDNSGGGTYSNISGATSSTYTIQAGDVGCNVRCAVTGTNGAGNSTANSNTIGIVSGTLPTPTTDLKFDDGSGTTATDAKGIVNSTFSGAPTWGSGYASAAGTASTGYADSSANSNHYTNQKWTRIVWFQLNALPSVTSDMMCLGTNASTTSGNRSVYTAMLNGASSITFNVTDSSSTDYSVTASSLGLNTSTKVMVVERYDPTGSSGATIMKLDVFKEGTGSVGSASKTDASPMRQNTAYKACDRRLASGTGLNAKWYRDTWYAGVMLTDQQLLDIFAAGSESTAY